MNRDDQEELQNLGTSAPCLKVDREQNTLKKVIQHNSGLLTQRWSNSRKIADFFGHDIFLVLEESA